MELKTQVAGLVALGASVIWFSVSFVFIAATLNGVERDRYFPSYYTKARSWSAVVAVLATIIFYFTL